MLHTREVVEVAGTTEETYRVCLRHPAVYSLSVSRGTR